MGKGDKKTKRGKIVIGSTGVRRPRKKKESIAGVFKKAEPKPVAVTEEVPVNLPTEVPKKKGIKTNEPGEAVIEKTKSARTKKKTEEIADQPASEESKTE